jgi:hypothetical protein
MFWSVDREYHCLFRSIDMWHCAMRVYEAEVYEELWWVHMQGYLKDQFLFSRFKGAVSFRGERWVSVGVAWTLVIPVGLIGKVKGTS